MRELIVKYIENPSDDNKAKLARYLKQHKMAVCFATDKEIKLLRKIGLAN